MALDMRPRSTCRRLTKAIPAPDMTEACHGGSRASPPLIHHVDEIVPNRETLWYRSRPRCHRRYVACDQRARRATAGAGTSGSCSTFVSNSGTRAAGSCPSRAGRPCSTCAATPACVAASAPATAPPGPRRAPRRTTAGGRRSGGPGRPGADRSRRSRPRPSSLAVELDVTRGGPVLVRHPGLHARPLQERPPLRVGQAEPVGPADVAADRRVQEAAELGRAAPRPGRSAPASAGAAAGLQVGRATSVPGPEVTRWSR